jgi:protein SCO1/2
MKSLNLLLICLAGLSLPATAAPEHGSGHHHGHHTPLAAEEANHGDSLFHFQADWQSHRGETVQLADFEGRPTIITMIYGSCQTACPILVRDAQRIQQALPADQRESVQVVVVSFDPARDTPDALATYARDRAVDKPNWHYLNGRAGDIRTLATLLGIRYRDNGNGTFDHSNLVAVLDPAGRIVHRSEGLMQPVEGAVAAIDAALAARE